MGSSVTRIAVMVSLCLTIILSSCVTSPATPSGRPSGPLHPDYTYWPHEVSDLKPDPGIKFGVLSNGMRYAIMRNVQPAGAVSMKLRFASGSLQEKDDQRGLAHFLEHMAFNGSKNVPEGEFIKLLQRKGLAFGAHTNAYTSTAETVYMLELPKNTADLIDTGLMLFREVGSNLLLDQKAIDREKGVVLAEQRSRNTPEYRAFVGRWNTWYEGQRYAERMPIGLAETIRAATREQIAEYYGRNYRPERTLLVIVGDIEPQAIEKLIQAKFGDWKGEGADTRDPDIGPPKARGLVARSHVEPNLPEATSATWFTPASFDADTLANRLRDSRWWMASAIINRRLGRLARGENPPFVGASFDRSEVRGVSNSVALTIETKTGEWKRGLAAVEQEYRRAIEHGFTQREIDRELKDWRASHEDNAGSASTRRSGSLASTLVSTFASRSVFTHPKDELAIFERFAPTLTPETVLAGLKAVSGGNGPVVFVSSSKQIEGGDTALALAFEDSRKTPVSLSASQQAKEFPYTQFGEAGKVAERKVLEDLDVSLIRFENGVRLNFKRTDFEKETVNVTVRYAGGLVVVPPEKVGMYWVLPFAFTEGGLKKLTAEELDDSLAGRIVYAPFDLDETAFESSAQTNQRDFQLQMQLMAAYATDPAYRGLGLQRVLAAAESDIKQYSSSPGRVISREVSALVRSGDKRWQFPTLKQLQSITMQDIEKVVSPSLNRGPIEITVVGDLQEEEVVKAIAATFGALPKRLEVLPEPASARNIRFPKEAVKLRLEHEGGADQASAYVAWAGPDFNSNPKRARAVGLLREMLKVRLTEEFREVQGATYSPSASSHASTNFPGFGYMTASAETKPDLVEGFFKTLDAVIAELATGDFTDDLIERARTPIVKSIEKGRLGNGFWVGSLSDVQTDPRGIDAIRTQLSELQAITKAELVEVATQILLGKPRLELRIIPGKKKSVARDQSGTTTGRGSQKAQQRAARVLEVAN